MKLLSCNQAALHGGACLTLNSLKSIEVPNDSVIGAQHIAALCKAASDPLRIEIVRVLSKDSFGVQELARIFEMPQPGMSHHLKVLSSGGLVVSRRQGNSIFYRRAIPGDNESVSALISQLFSSIDHVGLSPKHLRHIAQVYEERSEQSRNFFARNADKFSENQGMLCELDQYLSNLKELIELTGLSSDSRVLEVGPGQGQLLKELSRRFSDLVALDSSSQMLAMAARQTASISQNTKLIEGSLENYELEGSAKFDAAIVNMVMHHMSSPSGAMQKLAELIRPGGFLLVAELCAHNQEWAKESCGDLWLGFEPQELDDWAAAAGFAENQSLYLGLKNGFQIQLKLFRR
jgi:ubiquinone/menaquinone biosynthesis C-methylase UbiE